MRLALLFGALRKDVRIESMGERAGETISDLLTAAVSSVHPRCYTERSPHHARVDRTVLWSPRSASYHRFSVPLPTSAVCFGSSFVLLWTVPVIQCPVLGCGKWEYTAEGTAQER